MYPPWWHLRYLAALAAWGALIYGFLRLGGWRALKTRPLKLTAPEWAAVFAISVFFAWSCASRHLEGQVEPHNIGLLPATDLAIWDLYYRDLGIPSLVHEPVRVVARYVGGIPLLVTTQAMFASLAALTSHVVIRSWAGPWTSVALLLAGMLHPDITIVLAELRCYPSFLAATGLGLIGMTWGVPALTFLGLGLASLDYPICITLLLGAAAQRVSAAGATAADLLPWRALRSQDAAHRLWGAACGLGVGILPAAWIASADFGRAASGLDPQTGFGVARAALLTLAAISIAYQLPKPRIGGIAAASGLGLITLLTLILARVLSDLPFYLLFLMTGLGATVGATLQQATRAWARGPALDPVPAAVILWIVWEGMRGIDSEAAPLELPRLYLPGDITLAPTPLGLFAVTTTALILSARIGALAAGVRVGSVALSAATLLAASYATTTAHLAFQRSMHGEVAANRTLHDEALLRDPDAPRLTDCHRIHGKHLLLRKAAAGETWAYWMRPELLFAEPFPLPGPEALCAAGPAWAFTREPLDCAPCTTVRIASTPPPHDSGFTLSWCEAP